MSKVNDKPSENSSPTIHPLLSERRSPYAFSDRAVEPDKIIRIMEAARWAPSCYNEQPWSFIIATNESPAEYEKMFACLVEANQEWARFAPVLGVSVARLAFERNDKPNAHARHDVGMASMNLAIQAMAEGLFVHFMGGFDPDKTRSTYNIPDGFEPVAAFALGYTGITLDLPEKFIDRDKQPRQRKELPSFVFSNTWGESAM